MKKKLFLLLLAGLLLAGCGGSTPDTEGNAGESFGQTEDVNAGTGNEEADAGTGEAGNTGTENTEEQVYVFEFEGMTTEGEAMTSEVFADSKLTMVNVWATFCGPCINEMPDLGEIAGAYDSAEFQMIGIVSDTVEGDADMLEEAKSIIEETGADYPHLLLNEQLYVNLVGASDSVPTTYFFNEKGELLGYLVGARSKAAWEEIINGLLEEIG